ncbi:MAG TPA: AI-2E family transporter [Terriglobales bacterium]|nr:AI-2E family transporter [Terriglobales bacterium]
MASAPNAAHDKGYFLRAREIFVRVSLMAALAVTCFLILKPFIPILAWGVVIAAAGFPGYKKLSGLLGGREKLAAVLCTLLLLSVIVIPAILLAGTLTHGAQAVAAHMEKGDLRIPPPPEKVQAWPAIGKPLYKLWTDASENLGEILDKVTPMVQQRVPALLSAGAQVGATLLEFILSILLAGFILINSRGNAQLAHQLFRRIFGERGPEYEALTVSTVRSVTNGILGVALIQSVLASLGFLVVGLPGAGLWTLLFFIAAVLQLGVVVLVPAVAYAFAITSTTSAIVFTGWCIFVGLIDNVIKPVLLGRASQVPTLVIFLGVIGGFVAMGIIGLFVGAIVLSVGYKLFLAWLEDVEPDGRTVSGT